MKSSYQMERMSLEETVQCFHEIGDAPLNFGRKVDVAAVAAGEADPVAVAAVVVVADWTAG